MWFSLSRGERRIFGHDPSEMLPLVLSHARMGVEEEHAANDENCSDAVGDM